MTDPMKHSEKKYSEIEKREAERAAWDAAVAWWTDNNASPASDYERDKRFPSLTPRAEKVTLSDGSEWEYAPHVVKGFPWLRLNDKPAYCINPANGFDVRVAADYRAIADAIDRYHAREGSR